MAVKGLKSLILLICAMLALCSTGKSATFHVHVYIPDMLAHEPHTYKVMLDCTNIILFLAKPLCFNMICRIGCCILDLREHSSCIHIVLFMLSELKPMPMHGL